MPIHPRGTKDAILTKSPKYGNAERFSTGKSAVTIKAWEVWNSRYRRQTAPQAKVYNDDTTCVVRTHNRLAAELESDDSLTLDGYTYSVQQVHPVETPLGLRVTDYEISLK